MKSNVFPKLILLFVSSLIVAGCEESSPTASQHPVAKPNSLAFENLNLVRQLEKRRRTDTILTEISAFGVEIDGRISPGSAWLFVFTKVATETLYPWFVYQDGHIEEIGGQPPSKPGVITVDIGPFLRINSDQAISAARSEGANTYIKRYPNTIVRIRYLFQFDVPVCKMEFDQHGADCSVEFWLHAESGELLSKDTSCLE